jgi:hypothetical protein
MKEEEISMDYRAGPMNNTVFSDPNVSDDIRRQQPYDGQLFVYAARPSVLALANFARSMIEDAFSGLDPRTAQRSPLASRIIARHPRVHGQPMAIVLVVELDN